MNEIDKQCTKIEDAIKSLRAISHVRRFSFEEMVRLKECQQVFRSQIGVIKSENKFTK